MSDEVRLRLQRAALSGKLAQSILLHGVRGAGKERLGLWLARLLLCAEGPASGGCGHCHSCRLVDRLEHPDVHWFFPLPRPEGAAPEKLRERLEDARAAELALRRADPHHVPRYDRPPAIYLAAVQQMQQLAGARPALGTRKVFVVGDAELMVPQEASQEAANAFLKLLEEPPADTTIILTSSQPGALLPTILSRVQSLRVPGRPAARPPEGDEPAGRGWLIAALSSTAVPRMAAAAAQKPFGGRGDFARDLESLERWLRDLMAVAAGADAEVSDPAARDLLRRAVERRRIHPLVVAAALDRVSRAHYQVQGNVNPQLILAELLRGVQADLVCDVQPRSSA